ncbi:hypothetical protein XELAEV_18003301mg [Xenopus laevis]|nr:hypothetical protein XELAEV_18003301mg [Xenopus laevis]
MSLALHELLLCCRQIETDKATERKKEIVKFRRLLRDPETVQQLDQNSDRRQGKQLNWDTVFRFLQKYVYKETESIKSAKASVSQATQSNRRKKMQEISCVVKDFIRCANKRAPRLKCTELLLHVTNTVKDPTSCSAYGTDYSSILLKDILSVRKYWCEITFQQWEDLLTLYFSLYLKPESTVNRLLVARIIHTLTRGCCQQTDGLHSMFFQFFSKTMKRVREEKNPPGLDQILAALNVFLTSASVNCRMRVSKLGEDLFSTVLRIWTMQRPKDALKEEIVEFFRLLLRIHHPKGAKTVDEGAYAFDPDRWKRNLYSLYDTLVNEISQIGSRGKYSSGSRNIAAKENLVELMADICHQLFTEDTQVLDITQASFLVTQREPSGAASKRRRIELGWEVLRDNLQKSHNDFDIIPWLQIATCLIARYPASLPSSELTPLLTVLHQLLAQQRRGERATYVLHCLKEVAVCLKQKTDVKITPKSDLHKLWSKVWAVTLRSISSPQTEEESFALLASILQGGLIPADTDFWKIFSGAAAKPSSPGVHCLALALTSYCLPEHISVGFDNPMHEANGSQSSLKEEIIKWLLFGHLDDEVEDTNELSPVITKDFSNPALQKILVSLTMKDSRAAMKFFRSLSECSYHNKREDEASFADAEELYLHTSFSEIPGVPPVGPMEADKDGSSPCLTVNLAIREKLERDLLTLSEQQLNSYSSEATPPVNLVQCACLLTGVLGCYLYADIITEEDALQSHLFQKAKMLMQCAGESTSFLKSKLNEDAKISSLAALITQCVGCICNCTKDTPIRFLTDLFLHLFTPRMLNDLTDIGKLLLTSTGSSVETSELDLIGDDAESRMETEDQGAMDLFDDHCVAEPAENIEYGELQHVTGALSPLSEEHLTKQEAVLLQTLEFLCLCTTAAQNHTVNFRPSDTRRKLLALIDNNSLDISKPLHLHVYLLLLNELPKADAPLPVDEIITLLRPLIEVCSSYRRDQDVCAAILKKLLPVVNCLGQDPMDTEETYDAQGQLLNVIQAFWILAKDGKYTAVVRASLVNCMKALLKVDPQSKWAILTVDDQDVPVRDAFPAFLADSHHQVRFHTAVSISRLFQDVKAQALPLQLQQKAFDNIYLKVQEGMRYLSRSSSDPDEVPDETWNRRATLLMLISAILRCSPVCEKQALFAICQSVKENGLDPQLIRKASLLELGRVSTALGYRGVKDFMASHLDYLILEWLRMKVPGQESIQEKVCDLLNFLVIENKDNENLYHTIKLLDPFPDIPLFKNLRQAHQKIKYSKGPFSLLKEIQNFLSVSVCDSLPLTRLEGLNDLRKQLEQHKDQIKELVRDCQGTPQDSVIASLVVNLLQLSKNAVHQSNGKEVLGKPVSGTAFDDNFWLDLNYLEVAMAVQSCAAHFTALLYSEIYTDKVKQDGEQRTSANRSNARKCLKFEEGSQTLDITGLSEKSKEETGISLQDLLMDIYRSIGEPDSLYGCGGGKMLHPLARIRTYEHEAKWGKALVTFDLEMNLPPVTRQAGIMQALQNFGLCHMLSTYLRGLEHENAEWSSELQEIHFQAAWRNMQWDDSLPTKNETSGPGYHESLYRAVQSLRDKEFCGFHDHIKYARQEVEELCSGSLESVYSLYPALCRLQAIGELASVGQMFSRSITDDGLKDTFLKWQRQSQLLKDSDFEFLEPVLSLRSVILETLLQEEKKQPSQESLKDILTKHLLDLSRIARSAGNTQLPEKAMFQIKQYNPSQLGVSEWQLEEAQIFWDKEEPSLAREILKQMINKLEIKSFEVENDSRLRLLYAESLRLCGKWLAETCLESPTVIMQNYLEKAVEFAGYSDGAGEKLQEGRMKAFLSLARFSDAQYQRIDNYMKSSEFENKQALLRKAKEEVGLIKQHKVQNNRYTVKVERELQLDECAILALREDRKRFLCKAVENYISCLVSGEEHDMWIFRLCSLWLENSAVSDVNSMMRQDAQKIPSHKFLPLMYQLAARMGTKKMGNPGFHDVLNNLIGRISMDHPHHTLFIILALANANKDDQLMKVEAVKRSRLTKNAPKQISQLDKERMEAARHIVDTIKKRRTDMVRDVERLCDAYITLANMDANQWKSQRNAIPIPSDQPITKLNKLHDVVIPTMEIKVDPSGEYENLVTIVSFKPEFRLAGGLNLPKIIDCVGSDGKERRQLVKFPCMCRELLQLSMHRYDTYFPKITQEKKMALVNSDIQNLHGGVLGYIVGLGDRHVQNILIDEESAELVHIDLGVAFEQGKILPTPETVPFRLTRDIVDGMGITGVEGVFRRCCEKTMEVMRNNQEALLTIVEVLLYDPLFDWTMNPLKALYLQQDEVDLNATLGGDDPECNRNSCDSQSVNKVAERVLLRLQEKLKGVEEGMVLSVGGQVNHLIQQAMDPKNLSRLFPGWKAWV